MTIPMSEAVKYNRIKANITQIHECLGEYESQLWCGHCIVDGKCAQITMAVNELTETRKRLAGELLIADGKLEAVKNLLKEYIEIPSAYHQLRRSKITQSLKILGAEG